VKEPNVLAFQGLCQIVLQIGFSLVLEKLCISEKMPPARNKRASNAQVKKVNNGKETPKV
jgi:hypothetical protein